MIIFPVTGCDVFLGSICSLNGALHTDKTPKNQVTPKLIIIHLIFYASHVGISVNIFWAGFEFVWIIILQISCVIVILIYRTKISPNPADLEVEEVIERLSENQRSKRPLSIIDDDSFCWVNLFHLRGVHFCNEME